MERITRLRSCGQGRNCLIVGGGHSAAKIDAASFDGAKMVVNDSFYDFDSGKYMQDIQPDFLVCSDSSVNDLLVKMNIPRKTAIISYVNTATHRARYYYSLSDLWTDMRVKDHSNTGLKALVIAKDIMRFDRIYLTGFDFKPAVVDGKAVSHLNGDRIGSKYIEEGSFQHHLRQLPAMAAEFLGLKNTTHVYNTNPDSLLTAFAYGVP